jgi:glycosyltransferase involved in cell wall biosynthesis
MISFVIPAFNEEALIGRTIDAIRFAAESCRESYEILVADDASTDQTARITREKGATVIPVNLRQISATRNAGAREARGDKLFFVDADTEINPQVLQAALDALAGGAIGGGSAVSFEGEVPRYAKIIQPIFIRILRALRCACGCFLFCTRQAFDAVGGFDEELFASEEIWMSRSLRRQGKFVVLRESVVTSGRKLRMYSGRDVLRIFTDILLGGPSALKRREGLELWYSGHREDTDVVNP